MNVSGRERRLLMVLGGVVLLLAVYFLFFRGGETVEVPDEGPIPVVTQAIPTIGPSPTFVVPPGARDPFRP